ncbi:MAG TPA: class II aldolase/adducin family protein [candidate division WOR-3 bacterium]|uniref:Class II aldolase/adducin family protein n=1 Tax=candidate division WOR-3 bacterium TaxID=2052148 RepID=A0A7V5HMJ2_UNCW3|nr:class II aldolase/adducin family protein [candidate division WOR-3 bacterium]
MLSFPELRKEIIKYCVLMYENNYVVASDGNISVRISEGHFLITPSDKRKAELEYKDLIVINKEGNVIEGNFTPSKEMWMHIWIYEMRPDVNAVIHAHPPYSTAFSFQMPREYVPQLPEVEILVGKIGFVPYREAGSLELAKLVKEKITEHNGLILQKHGVVAVGANLEEAFNRLERMEFEFKIKSLRESFR